MKKVGFYVGSFDPFTKGHLAIVCEALCTFDVVIIGVGINPSKKTLFNKSERENLVASSIDDFVRMYHHRLLNRQTFTHGELGAVTRLIEEPECLKIVSYEDLTVDAAIRMGATSLIRGERIVGDHEAEMALSVINRELLAVRKCHLDMSSIPVPDIKLTYVSSSAVKNLCSLGEYVAAKQYVMPSVHQELMKKCLCGCYPYSSASKRRFLWQELCEAYSSKQRFYHNLSHVGYCLNYVDIWDKRYRIDHSVHSTFSDEEKKALTAAIFYHDYFCSGQEDDEARSAEKAKEDLNVLRCDFPDVEPLIMMTKHTGNYREVPFISQLIHDVDLAILGDRENYGTYAMQIRCEYSRYNTQTYALKRSEVLRRLIDSDYLYLTHFFRDKFTEDAELNMKTELAYWEERL